MSLARKVLKWVPEDGEAKEVVIVAVARLVAPGSRRSSRAICAEAEGAARRGRDAGPRDYALEDRKLDRRSVAALADGIAAEESRRSALERENGRKRNGKSV